METKEYMKSDKYKEAIANYKSRINRLAEEEIKKKKESEPIAGLDEFEADLSSSTNEHTNNVREHYRSKLQEKLEVKSDFRYLTTYRPATSKSNQFEEAWRNLIHYGDHKLFDEIVHPDYYTMNQGVKLNKDTSRRVLLKRKGQAVMGPFEILYENYEFLGIQRYSRVNLYTWFSMISCVKYKEGMVYTQHTVREPLQVDPSKEEGWSWDDYKP
jgi:hypothetical protein